MLLEAGASGVPDVPTVTLYADDTDHTRMYAVPTAPRVARGDAGTGVDVMLYRRGTVPGAPPLGGQVSLTTTLALDDAERQGITAALDAALNRGRPPDAPAASITLLSPEWLDGHVQVTLLPGLTLEGRPSLMAANECVLTASLDAAQAAALQDAWRRGLPGATVTYAVTCAAALPEARTETEVRASPTAALTSSFHSQVTRMGQLSFTLQGPLSLTPRDLTRGLQTATL